MDPLSDLTRHKAERTVGRLIEEAHRENLRFLEEHREELDELASRLLHRVGIAGDEMREVVGRRMGEEEEAAAKKKKRNLSVLHNPRGHQAALLGAELPGDKAERERLLVLLAPP